VIGFTIALPELEILIGGGDSGSFPLRRSNVIAAMHSNEAMAHEAVNVLD
jgi:hypothetical protein